MSYAQTLKDKRRAGIDRMKSLRDAAQLGNRALSADERTEINGLLAQDEQLDADIKAAEKLDAIDQRLSQGVGRQTQPDGTAGRIEPVAPEKFKSLGEQLQAIAWATKSGQTDNRLRQEFLAASGASAGVPSDGGYLIQKDFVAELSNKMFGGGQILPRVRRIPISGNSDGLTLTMVDETSRANGSRWGGVQVYWGAEADAATASKPKLRQSKLELKDLIGLAYMTDRLLADASAMEAVFSQAFSEEMTFKLEDAIVNGTGAGMPLGVLNSGAVVSVAKETGQAAATINYDNVLKMWNRLWAANRAGAVWFINQDAEPQLNKLSMPIGTGGVPVYLPAGGVSGQQFSTLFGRPVVPVEYCATLGTTGDVILADLSQYVMIEKGGIKADSSIHVRFVNNENTFRYLYRTDGQPLWNSPLTPYKGSNTYSPFVKLDTRA